MSAFIDRADAIQALATAAGKVVRAWPYHDVPSAIRDLSCAVRLYEQSRPLAATAPAEPGLTDSTELASCKVLDPPRRFKLALQMVDPAAVDPSGLARGIIAACAEVCREHGLPCNDPAVLLIVRQLAWACEVADDSGPFAELITECWRRDSSAPHAPALAPPQSDPKRQLMPRTTSKEQTMPPNQFDRSERIRKLNDEFRSTLQGGRFLITSGVNALGRERVFRLVSCVRTFAAFDPTNDPHGEHDFGAFDDAGDRFFWKIDYYDPTLSHHSDDASDASKTVRVLTLLRAEEY